MQLLGIGLRAACEEVEGLPDADDAGRLSSVRTVVRLRLFVEAHVNRAVFQCAMPGLRCTAGHARSDKGLVCPHIYDLRIASVGARTKDTPAWKRFSACGCNAPCFWIACGGISYTQTGSVAV